MRMLFILSLAFLFSCENNMVIVNDVEEREANEIIVFLASKDIPAIKTPSPSTAPGGGGGGSTLWSINVDASQATDAMSILNQNGLPRKKGTDLLTLFAKSGLMSSDKEETIRYQAGLAVQLANTIRMIDGVIDADVQLSFPPPETGLPGGTPTKQKVTASIYVKHQGVLDDPNSHLVTKIKRLVAGSVNGLDINDVTVISDRSRFTDISLQKKPEVTAKGKEYVSIWSIVMSKSSAARFRVIFFTILIAAILFAVILGWMAWKFYPLLKKGGLRQMLNPVPLQQPQQTQQQMPPLQQQPPPEEPRIPPETRI